MRRYVNEFEDPCIVENSEIERLKDLIQECNHQLEALGSFGHEGRELDNLEDLSCDVVKASVGD